ncbi:uncharacterized protein LOC113519817 [Galleria mellonella]|uniref:Uncharacterized protein LOC113519817 n=1 Tax=Galleria mellonella TaxID=7137 RepID=A0A6J1WXC0_GALME|nr:uncharacterized protein LOC113519817 [Galleria mellonella]
MSKKVSCVKMVATKNKSKVLRRSTPEHAESPSRDSDSICDSEAGSPVPFLCTQDGAEGETDVVWNFYTPKSENTFASHLRNSTPLSRKTKKSSKNKQIERQLPRRKVVKPSQKRTELFQDLIELNQNLHELIGKKPVNSRTPESRRSENEDIFFNDTLQSPRDSPKSGLKTNSRCLRRNVLSSKFSKHEPETALESDDSMNECLLKASQVVEENIMKHEPTAAKKVCYEKNKNNIRNFKPDFSFKINEDSMDAILNSIKLESPAVSKTKKCNSPHLNNDSFDTLVSDLNDSALEKLTQMPVVTNRKVNFNVPNEDNWKVKELTHYDGSPSTKVFGRHSSMPESPSCANVNKPSTSGMAFGRYNSMPYGNDAAKCSVSGDSPIKCSPDEIERKRLQAREKLIAKRLLPFTATQRSSPLESTQSTQQAVVKRNQFQLKIPSSKSNALSTNVNLYEQKTNNSLDLKLVIEKKRQEALMKLRRRRPVNK